MILFNLSTDVAPGVAVPIVINCRISIKIAARPNINLFISGLAERWAPHVMVELYETTSDIQVLLNNRE